MMQHLDSPMGRQFELHAEIDGRRQRAVVTERGGTLRALEIDGIALVQDYPATSLVPMSAGAVLVPWPNRIAGAVWMLDGVRQQLPVTEPVCGHAIHGLLGETSYTMVERTENKVVLAASIQAQDGYPFELSTSVAYELDRDGLGISHTLTNTGVAKAPVAVGNHPYLRLGNIPVGELKLVINADSHVELDAVMIPTGTVTDVGGTALDFQAGQVLGSVALDDAWTDLRRDAAGGSTHFLQAPDGSRVELQMDASFGYIQVYTTANFPTDTGPVAAVAMEPMTAPANAFNSGLDLHWIEPGESWIIGWGIRHRPANSHDATEEDDS